MGIRGAWSLVSSDPRRFGEPWACADDSVVWVDGPSLVYHLALQPKFDEIDRFHEHFNQMGQASPASIHRRTSNFISVLSDLAKEVHVVMDGLCSQSKVPTQIHRMKVAAQSAEGAARSTTVPRNCKVISILAEWSMVDAIRKLCKKLDNLHLHQPSHGEAEAFIDTRMGRYQGKRGAVIMSNDTDYLIYEHSPGFLPFSSLQFTPTKAKCPSLTGFHYLSSKFRNSISMTLHDNRLLSTVAGMAGCDYDDEVLQAGRALIIKSPIGGLRIKHQNKPTAQHTLNAVIRFVTHYSEHEASWREMLSQDIGGAALLEALDRVHEIYFAGSPLREEESLTISLESYRLRAYGMLYCRPIIEKWSTSAGSAKYTASKTRNAKNLSKRSRKRRKKKDAEVDVSQSREMPTNGTPQAELMELEDEIPSLKFGALQNLLLKESMWTLPHLKRFRALTYGLVKKAKGDVESESVSEWRRVGCGENAEYREFRILIPPVATVSPDDAAGSDLSELGVTSPPKPASIAASLLPNVVRWLWLLLVTSPDTLTHGQAGEPLDQEVANLISVAYFHSRIRTEVGCGITVGDCCLEKIDWEVGGWIWSVIRNMDPADLPGCFFESRSLASDVREKWRCAVNEIS